MHSSCSVLSLKTLFHFISQKISIPYFERGVCKFGKKLDNCNFIISFFVYKFKRDFGKSTFSDQYKKIIKSYIKIGYNLDGMRQSACLVLNQITVYSYGFLFNCTTVGQASDCMTALT